MMLDVNVQSKRGDFALDVTFEAPGGVTALFGPSGSGKSSVVNAVAGLLRPDAGRIAVAGAVLFDDAAGVDVAVHRRRVGYVFQNARLFPHMTVQQNLRYGGQHDEARVIELLGLGALLARRPASLSGGEAQRVALGRALMCDPQLLLMDEPLAALDGPRKAEIMPYLERLRDESAVPMIYVSHDVSEVARLATTLVVMDAGRVTMAGPVGDVLAAPEVVPLLGPGDAGAVIAGRISMVEDGLTTVAFDGGVLILPGDLGAVGRGLRLRVPAQDVILARDVPQGISALNILPVEITGLEEGGAGVAVGLRCGATPLLARLTRRSVQAMGLAVGQQVYAVIKATAVGPDDIGRR